MKKPSVSALSFFLLVIISCSFAASADGHDSFLDCLSNNYSSMSSVLYTRANPSFSSVLQFSIRNLRFMSESTPQPLVIITPEHETQIPPVILCARQNDLEIRTRCGGHDFEGLSSVSRNHFVIIDMINLSETTIDVEEKTAWVGGGATLGSVYYRIAEASPVLGFPGGLCPTVGVGGHISGGGYGTLLRKYGLAADNVIDARIVNVNGEILDRKAMGERLFWAIRGGGGASFGVIVAWKIRLVDVPERVTVFNVLRTVEQNATQLLHRWQYVAPRIDNDLFMAIVISRFNSSQNNTAGASFFSTFLGGVDRLLPLMQDSFPELGLVREDCIEMSFVESVLYHAGFPIEQREILLNRTQPNPGYSKIKQDYVEEPIPEYGFEGFWRFLYETEGRFSQVALVPYGGIMNDISASAIPFPHRAGNLYQLSNFANWQEDEAQNADRYFSWSRRLHAYVTPYVSNSPRANYFNYRDLDLGVNNVRGNTSYAQASIWGIRYFKNNFRRLAKVKTEVDPGNFFKHEQSIPILHSKRTRKGH